MELDEETIARINGMRRAGYPVHEIARRFGVPVSTFERKVRGKITKPKGLAVTTLTSGFSQHSFRTNVQKSLVWGRSK